MKSLALAAFLLLLLGCTQAPSEKIIDKPVSEDLEVQLIVGQNYTLGEPIAFQIKTSNYSIIFLNRSGGFIVGTYPSVWICRHENNSCTNMEYIRMKDFSRCESDVPAVAIPSELEEHKTAIKAETYDLLLLWDQTEWKSISIPCGKGFALGRENFPVPPGNYSVTFVYWVAWETAQRSVSADFQII
jgi:hypothetical protein